MMPSRELEYRLLYSMVVAGKSAKFATNFMRGFLQHAGHRSPLSFVRELIRRGGLELRLRLYKSGNYTKLTKGFTQVAQSRFNLRTIKPLQLELVHGIGPKTSRFFILWTRPLAEHAALDTHVLKWLRFLGHSAPYATPSGLEYERLEKIVIAQAKVRGMTPRELDAKIWDWCSSGQHKEGQWPKDLQSLL